MARYAQLMTQDDGTEIVNSVIVSDYPMSRENKGKPAFDLFEVPEGVKIGMVRGGPLGSVAGFGFPIGTWGFSATEVAEAQKKTETKKAAA